MSGEKVSVFRVEVELRDILQKITVLDSRGSVNNTALYLIHKGMKSAKFESPELQQEVNEYLKSLK